MKKTVLPKGKIIFLMWTHKITLRIWCQRDLRISQVEIWWIRGSRLEAVLANTSKMSCLWQLMGNLSCQAKYTRWYQERVLLACCQYHLHVLHSLSINNVKGAMSSNCIWPLQWPILDFQSLLVMNILRNDSCITNNNQTAHFEKKFMLLPNNFDVPCWKTLGFKFEPLGSVTSFY